MTAAMFCHLHVYSNHSFLYGASRIEELLDRATEQGAKNMALTDLNGAAAALPFYLEARERNIKPILGATIDQAPRPTKPDDDSADPPRAESKPPPPRRIPPPGPKLVCLARDREGYANLCQLITARHLDPEFSLPDAVGRYQHGLIVLVPDLALLRTLAPRIEPGSLYAELCNYQDRARRRALADLYTTARDLDVPVVAANAAAFHDPARHELHRVLVAIDDNDLLATQPAHRIAHPQAWLKPPEQMAALFARCPEAIANTARIAEQCNLEFELDRPRFPRCELPAGETPYSHLCKLSFAGLTRRYQQVSPEAFARLQHELALINRLGFAEYFLIVHDIAAFARDENIACVARGSAANSLVSYCLGLSTVEPLSSDLYFERFLNESRTDIPDIDLDFDWRYRDDVLDYIYRRYGHSRTAMIATINTFAARSAFRDIAKVFGLQPKRIDDLADKLPHYSSGTLREAILSFPEARNFPLRDPQIRRIVELAEAVDGFPRHYGIHVGGVVISDRELTWYMPLQRASKGIIITQFDMGPVEKMGLVKMDILAQRALAIVRDAARFVQQNHDRAIDLDRLPDPDGKTAELLRAGKTIGCFQIESPGVRNLLQQIRAECRMDVTHALSLIRPGPAGSGMKEHFILRKRGLEETTFPHPSMEPVLRDTYGVMLYQEDIMRVAQAVAGFTMATGDELRKAMTKKRRDRHFEKLRNAFFAGAAANGCTEQTAALLWELISNFAAYAYNKAHACTYGQIAYQCAYLKSHWPAEFMAAVLSNIGGYYQRREYLEEARRLGIPILLPDVNRSEIDYTTEIIPIHQVCATRVNEQRPIGPSAAPAAPIHRTAIRIGLMQVRALTQKNMQAIVTRRRRRIYRDLEDLLRRVPLSIEEARNLVLCGACDALGASRPELLWRLGLLWPKLQHLHRNGQADLFDESPDRADDISPDRFPRLDDYDLDHRIELELRYLDLAASDNPMAPYERLLAGRDVLPSTELPAHAGHTVTIAGIIIAMRRARTKDNRFMKFITVEDAHGVVEVTLFPNAYECLGSRLTSPGPFLVTGQVEAHHGAVTLSASDLKPLADRARPAGPTKASMLPVLKLLPRSIEPPAPCTRPRN